MHSTGPVLAALFCVLLACGPEAPALEGACPVTAPTLIVAAPDDFEPAEDVWYGLYRFGDDILFTFDRFDDPDREYLRVDRCTGEAEPYPALAGLHDPQMIETTNGRILYARDGANRPYVVDRFDVPGADEARPVLGLPDGVQLGLAGDAYDTHAPLARFWMFWTAGSTDSPASNAAGLDARTYAIYTHAGDPDVPVVKLGDRFLTARSLGPVHTLAHEDSGEVYRIDDATGERELLRTGVRYMASHWDARKFIWQAIGDDSVEPVYLHDLDTGEDVQIAVNDFAAMSWRRNEERIKMGEWVYVDVEDARAAAMIGPGDRFVAAARLDTGAAIEIPLHLQQRGSFAGYFLLRLETDHGEVEALWDPLTGEVHEWRPYTEDRVILRSIEGDMLEYFVLPPAEAASLGRGTLWRLDLTTGDAAPIVSDVDFSPLRLDATHYLAAVSRDRLPTPPGPQLGVIARELMDFKLIDSESGQTTTLVDKVSGGLLLPDGGITFIDAFGPEPGLWVQPLPFEASRSARRAGEGSELPRTPPPVAGARPT